MRELLKDFKDDDVDFFIKYVDELKKSKKKDQQTGQWENKNPWALNKKDDWFAELFKKNALTGLRFDGQHVTINQNGLSYDYIAYKNRLLLAYPETKISFSEVYEGDDFQFLNNSDGVEFKHKIANPFSRETSKIIGCYCVIKNERGEFLTLLDKNEIEKHRQSAKTQMIWKYWYVEMVYKTIIKKATRIHYEDVYKSINEEDNKDIEVEKLPEKRRDNLEYIKVLIVETKTDELEFFKYFKVKAVSELNFDNQDKAIKMLEKKLNKKDKK